MAAATLAVAPQPVAGVCRRLTGKQAAPQLATVVCRRVKEKRAAPEFHAKAAQQASVQAAIANSALVAEAWAEVSALAEDAQRQHVHYTHVRTQNPADRQPDSFTRQAFWKHIERVYAEAYPEPANTTKSILLFGAVAKEAHAASQDDMRDEHHHVPTYCSRRHYWKKVATLSYEKYGVKLNVVAHDGYYSMYSYITKPSTKKPLSELDQEIFLSAQHPRGALQHINTISISFAPKH